MNKYMNIFTRILIFTFAFSFSTCSLADLQNGKSVDKSKEERATFRSLKALANKGDAGAQYDLGDLYSKGRGTVKDEVAAVKWYRKAAEQNHLSAQFVLASHYDKGEGVDKDVAQAIFWYTKAAEQGHNQAQNNLGYMYEHGLGVPQDYARALGLYRQSSGISVLGVHAQYNLGLLYRDGKGVTKNLVVAYAWLTLARHYNHRDAGFDRGAIAKILSIEQIQQGKKLADNWEITSTIEEVSYDPALSDAQAGAVEQYNTGLAYEEGRGVEQDYKKAEEWYWKASENEYLKAQLRLAKMYEEGPIGIGKNSFYAKIMYKKAYENGYPEGKDELERVEVEQYKIPEKKPETTLSFNFVGSMGEDGFENYYANRNGIVRKGNKAKMLVLVDFENERKGADGEAYFSVKMNMEFDCKKSLHRMLSMSLFTGIKGSGDEIKYDIEIDPWARISKKSMTRHLFNVACGLV